MIITDSFVPFPVEEQFVFILNYLNNKYNNKWIHKKIKTNFYYSNEEEFKKTKKLEKQLEYDYFYK